MRSTAKPLQTTQEFNRKVRSKPVSRNRYLPIYKHPGVRWLDRRGLISNVNKTDKISGNKHHRERANPPRGKLWNIPKGHETEKNVLCSRKGKSTIIKMSIPPKVVYKLNMIQIKTSKAFFFLELENLKFTLKAWRSRRARRTLEGREVGEELSIRHPNLLGSLRMSVAGVPSNRISP